MKKEIIQTIIGIFAIIGMAFTAHAYFAKQNDLLLVKSSQQLHFLSHAVQEVQSQLWQIESRYGGMSDCSKYNERDRIQYKQLLDKLDRLKKKETYLIQKTTKQGS